MKTKFSLSTAIVAACFAAMALAAHAASPAPPQPKILVIDQNALFTQSKSGQDILLQVKAYTDQAEKDLKSQSNALQAEGEALQQQVAILSADAKTKKVQAFEAKQNAFQHLAQQKQAMIQGGFVKARSQIEQLLGPILQQIMVARGANLLIDRNAVIMSTDKTFDITALAIDQLNKKVSTIKVDLVAAPSGSNVSSATH